MSDIENIQADLDSHHIEGIAYHGDTPFSMSLITHIEGNLWTGGCIDGVELPHDFEYVISLYPWEKFKVGGGTRVFVVRMFDSVEMDEATAANVRAVADLTQQCMNKGKTLVHCQAGLNRSGLVAATALVRGGRTPGEAVALLREKRSPAVLCNPTFHQFVLDYTP